jgi:aryl-alcohol dehydrogenase-like predicted oxidoreductase
VSQFSRREFLKTSLAVGAMSTVGTLPVYGAKRTATDMVTLGKSGMKVTRLAFGTGTNNGRTQAALGQQEFTRLVHYAYDKGIRFFETCDTYATPAMLGEALKDIPRDSYQLMSKLTTNNADPQEHFQQMLRISQTEYYDIMLLHWQHTDDWVSDNRPLAGWRPAGAGEEDYPGSRRVGAWPARAAPDAGQQVAADRDDPHEP